MAYQRFYDDFTDGSVGVQTYLGNGIIEEPPGFTSLVLRCVAGQNCDWTGASFAGAPIGYVDLLPYINQNYNGGLIDVRCKFTGGTKDDTNVWGGLTIWTDEVGYFWKAVYRYKDGYWALYYCNGGSQTEVWSASAGGTPDASPHWFWFRYNPTHVAQMTEWGWTIQPQVAHFWFSKDNGTNWTDASSGGRAMGWTPRRVGVVTGNGWSATPAFRMNFDWLFIGQYDPYQFIPPDQQTAKVEKAAIEDVATFPSSGGQLRHRDPNVGRGFLMVTSGTANTLVEGSPAQVTHGYEDGPVTWPYSGIHDRYIYLNHGFPQTGGGARFWTELTAFEDDYEWKKSGDSIWFWLDRHFEPEPGLGIGARFYQERNYYEERLLVELSNGATWMYGKNDSEGHQFLDAYDIAHVEHYQTAGEQWHAPVPGDGFYGCARDGSYYWNGETCQPGTLGTLAGGINGRSWSSVNPPLDRVCPNNCQYSVTADGEITFTATGGGNPWDDCFGTVASHMHWYLTGDFDISVEFASLSVGGGATDGGLIFEAYIDPNNYFYTRRRFFGSNVYDKDVKNNGSWSSYASVATTNTSGRLRLVRVGAVVRSYYWTGSAWAQIGGDYTMSQGAKPMWVCIGHWTNEGEAIYSFKMKNFTINSGSWTNKSAWYREAAGAHRSSRPDFPTNAAIVHTTNGLNIIDVDSNKLWMRFIKGSTSVFTTSWNSAYMGIRRAVMKNGLLLISYSTWVGSSSPCAVCVWIDFTLDWIRIYAHVTSSVTGGERRTAVSPSTDFWARDTSQGNIADRNGDYGYVGDRDSWQIVGGSALLDCDTLFMGSYQYTAKATDAGLHIHKWRRWFLEGKSTWPGAKDNEHIDLPDWSKSAITSQIWWCKFDDAGKVYYMTSSNVYAALKTTWEMVMDEGTFVHNQSVTLPACTFSFYSQRRMVMVPGTSDFYMATDEGIWKITWPGPGWTLLYGKPGSGATYEILPAYDYVRFVTYTTDGAIGLLVATLQWNEGGRSQLIAIRLSTNAVYAQGQVDSGGRVGIEVAA